MVKSCRRMGKANPSKSAVLESSYCSLRWGWRGRVGWAGAQIHSPQEMGSDRTPMGQFRDWERILSFICALPIHSFTLQECGERDPGFSNREACFRLVLVWEEVIITITAATYEKMSNYGDLLFPYFCVIAPFLFWTPVFNVSVIIFHRALWSSCLHRVVRYITNAAINLFH